MSHTASLRRRAIITGAACGLVTLAAPAVADPSFPNRPIKLILPFPPGGSTNVLARLLGQKLSESIGQPVVVENRAGANAVVGTDAVAKSAPDGYTLLLTLNAHIITPLLAKTPYDPMKDFQPLTTVATGEILLVVNPTVKANNLQELIALAKARPGELNYASAGLGTPLHLAAESFNLLAGVKITNVPYKGSGPAVADLLSGQVQMYFSGPLPSIPFVQSGKLRAIAYSGDARFASLPTVPTFTEAGLPGYNGGYWYGVLAPAGTPRDIANKLTAEITKAMAQPDLRETLIAQGMQPVTSSQERFAAILRDDTANFTRIIKAANIKAE